ncbi:MAG: DUF6263 family protein [Planctomycetota bacterium]|jgi:outer membrane biosynthesis protein TonB
MKHLLIAITLAVALAFAVAVTKAGEEAPKPAEPNTGGAETPEKEKPAEAEPEPEEKLEPLEKAEPEEKTEPEEKPGEEAEKENKEEEPLVPFKLTSPGEGEKIALVPKYTAGRKLYMTSKASINQKSFGIPGLMQFDLYATKEALEPSEEGNRIRFTYNRVIVERKQGLGSFTYDTADEGVPDNLTMFMFKAMVGNPITITFDNRNEPLKAEGYAKIREKVIEMLSEVIDEETLETVKDEIEIENVEKDFSERMRYLPTEPVAKGAKWEFSRITDSGGLGRVRISGTSEFTELKDDVAVLKQTYKIPNNLDIETPSGAAAKVEKMGGTLEIHFNVKEGEFVKILHEIDMKLTVKTETMDVPVEQSVEQTVTFGDKSLEPELPEKETPEEPVEEPAKEGEGEEPAEESPKEPAEEPGEEKPAEPEKTEPAEEPKAPEKEPAPEPEKPEKTPEPEPEPEPSK